MTTCPACQAPVTAEDRFCPKCGEVWRRSVPAPPVQRPPVPPQDLKADTDESNHSVAEEGAVSAARGQGLGKTAHGHLRDADTPTDIPYLPKPPTRLVTLVAKRPPDAAVLGIVSGAGLLLALLMQYWLMAAVILVQAGFLLVLIRRIDPFTNRRRVRRVDLTTRDITIVFPDHDPLTVPWADVRDARLHPTADGAPLLRVHLKILGGPPSVDLPFAHFRPLDQEALMNTFVPRAAVTESRRSS